MHVGAVRNEEPCLVEGWNDAAERGGVTSWWLLQGDGINVAGRNCCIVVRVVGFSTIMPLRGRGCRGLACLCPRACITAKFNQDPLLTEKARTNDRGK